MGKIILGCIADDFTGASDIASQLIKLGAKCLLINDFYTDYIEFDEYDVVIIALKSRSIEKSEAVRLSLDAIKWLEHKGVNKFYFKIASTFDSTDKGNIGPVMDALLDYFNLQYAVICPAFLENGRTVKDGNLYVNDILLEESTMRLHPINPMLYSSLTKLMNLQSKYDSYDNTNFKNFKEISPEYLKTFQKKKFYYFPDFYTFDEGEKIASIFYEDKLFCGASGFAVALYKKLSSQEKVINIQNDIFYNNLPIVILSGSCSDMTKKQIIYYKNQGYKTKKIFLNDEKKVIDEVQKINKLNYSLNNVILFHTVDLNNNVSNNINESMAIENMFSTISKEIYDTGIKNIIVAGGESSGAVIKGIGFSAFKVLEEIDVGVPFLQPINNGKFNLVLKSGNFGKEDFFVKVINKIKDKNLTN